MIALSTALILSIGAMQPRNDVQRIVSSSGAVTIFEAVPDSKTLAIHLFASAKGCQETPETHGRRHLLEHLLAKGRNSDLGSTLEKAGWTISADTNRDFMTFKLEGPPNRWRVAFDALADIVSERTWTPEQIAKERKIIDQELAIVPQETRVGNQAWNAAFGNAGLDPFGSSESLSRVSPSELQDLFTKQMAQDNLTISIVGPSPIPQLESVCKGVWALSPKPRKAQWVRRAKTASGSERIGEASVAYATAPGFSHPTTAWILAAALAIASEGDSRFVSYTPCLFSGLVLVGSTSDFSIEAAVGKLQSQSDRLFETGRQLALAWVARQQQSTASRANWNGVFQSQAIGGNAESLTENIQNMTQDQFQIGMGSFVDRPTAIQGAPRQ